MSHTNDVKNTHTNDVVLHMSVYRFNRNDPCLIVRLLKPADQSYRLLNLQTGVVMGAAEVVNKPCLETGH